MTVFGDAPSLGWERLLEAGEIDERLVATSVDQHHAASWVEPPSTLAPQLREALLGAGIDGLYSHQVEALEAAARGDVIVTSGTASGKSLSFNLPVLDAIARDPKVRALYLYPTKALAQDQARKLAELRLPELRPAIYDGDTPREDRPAIRRRSNLILTNPDMLNMAVLAHHKGWGDFLVNLRYVVVDEAHTYRGVFGSHVSNVLRRLRRVARLYGADPRFICASATIANPAELASALTGTEFELVDSDGAPRAKRRVAVWNPPIIDPQTMRRRSVLSEAAELLADLVINGSRTICFLRSRRGIELIQRFTRDRLRALGEGDLADRIAPYRAGYTPQQRREIEGRLMGGELLAVVATDALELGIDIGELDAAICVTFPGTVASLRQMWGAPAAAARASRSTSPARMRSTSSSAATRRSSSRARSKPRSSTMPTSGSSPRTCSPPPTRPRSAGRATSPAPRRSDPRPRLARARRRARRARPLRRARDGRYLPRASGFPAGEISLRSASLDAIAVVDRDLRGDARLGRGRARLYDRPSRRDLPAPRALLRGARARHRGPAGDRRELRRRLVHAAEEGDDGLHRRGGRAAEIGPAPRRRAAVRRRLGHRAGDRLPAQEPQRPLGDRPGRARSARAELSHPGALVRARRPACGPSALEPDVLLGALHAAEHSQIAVLPLLAMCDRWDIGGLSTNVHFQTGAPTIFIYDGHPGGVGIARRGSSSSSAWSATPPAWWGSAPAPTAVPRACRARSAATSTSRCTSPARSS